MLVIHFFQAIDQAFRSDLVADWYWLYLQILLLGTILGVEIARPRRRNLYAILIVAAMLLLVQGQAWWMLSQFQQTGALEVRHLFQIVSLDGARLANFYIGLGVVCFSLSYWIGSRRVIAPPPRAPVAAAQAASPLTSLLVAGWTLGASLLLITLLGGFQAALAEPGRAVAGQTLLLVAVGLGKLPLLHKVVIQARWSVLDVALFMLTLGITLLNSRFLTAFMLLQVALLLNYCWREVSRRALVGLIFVLFLVFIVFGLYRDFGNTHTVNGALDVAAVQEFFSTRTVDDTASWFYSSNVEGFTGVAGILTYELNNGGLTHDLGLSTFDVIVQLLPNGVRTDPSSPIAGLADYLSAAYPYKGSVVPPGFENAYANFGLFGILILGGLLGYLACWLHRQMLRPAVDRLRVGVPSVEVLQLVRGTFVSTLFFGVADLVLVVVYGLLLNLTGSISTSLSSRLPPHNADLRQEIQISGISADESAGERT
ncbi:MAG TPA: hypothetical protein VKY74_09705 [Chloroflexia bacterium]|nr:hypothetical protein [Chloroflexia bacterium]